MHKILFIGKLTPVTKKINAFLAKYFEVQMATSNYQVISAMIRLKHHHLVIMDLDELEMDKAALIQHFKEDFKQLPIMCFGSDQVLKEVDSVLDKGQFITMEKPIVNQRLLDTICITLNLTMNYIEESEKIISSLKHILVVDDSAIQLRTVREFLKDQYEVSVALSGAEALEMLAKRVPDLIILDYDMPVCDGKMAMEKIRSLPYAKKVPIAFLTGYGDEAHVREVASLHPAAYLLKPTTQAKLLEMVEKILGE